ncbi:hypothetical protein I79_006567 [Cricetulus griseus]|uniref:Uncharacterized protein n=1 Tax=Cricetulus griseus TaxID=10029 RepID=G3H869_CRIGR|nr:hypothetical protein I79_006567 [Cricetulus griseus]
MPSAPAAKLLGREKDGHLLCYTKEDMKQTWALTGDKGLVHCHLATGQETVAAAATSSIGEAS